MFHQLVNGRRRHWPKFDQTAQWLDQVAPKSVGQAADHVTITVFSAFGWRLRRRGGWVSKQRDGQMTRKQLTCDW